MGEFDKTKLTGLWEQVHETFRLVDSGVIKDEDEQANIKEQIASFYQKHTSSGLTF